MKRQKLSLHRKKDGAKPRIMKLLLMLLILVIVGALENAGKTTIKVAKDTRVLAQSAKSVLLFKKLILTLISANTTRRITLSIRKFWKLKSLVLKAMNSNFNSSRATIM